MGRQRVNTNLRRIGLGVLMAMCFLGPRQTPVGAEDRSEREVRAVLDGSVLSLPEVAAHHCHDLSFPVIRCFRSARSRDLDVASMLDSTPYVTVFKDADHGGGSYTFGSAWSDLSTIGWNDIITSFKSLNGGRPRFYQHSGYGTPSWRWAAGAWVSYVRASANDTFSSLDDAPRFRDQQPRRGGGPRR